MMFLGLLKRAYQETEFDKDTFFYSEWELAFLTLWSTLNEIQEVYFVKTKQVENPKGSGQYENTHPDGTPLVLNWELKNQRSMLFWNNFEYDNDNCLEVKGDKYKSNTYSYFFYASKGKNFFFNKNFNVKSSYEYESKLYMQIAYILTVEGKLENSVKENRKIEILSSVVNYPKHRLKKVLSDHWKLIKDNSISSLLSLNNYRNHLYLTHGENDSLSNFDTLYRSKRTDDEIETFKINIEKLFEVIYLMCRGIECKW